MKMQLNTWERVSLVSILNESRGPLGFLRKAGKALDVLEMGPEEREEVNYREVFTPQGLQIVWDDDDKVWDLDLADREAAHILRQAATNYEGWRVLDRDKVDALIAKLTLGKKGTEPDSGVP